MGNDESDLAANMSRRPLPDAFPDWAPVEVMEWLRRCAAKFPIELVSLYVQLVTDSRMREVWGWYSGAVSKHGVRGLYVSLGGTPGHMEFVNDNRDGGFGLCWAIGASRRLPAFPGDLSAAERDTYLAKVRLHANALIDLLRPTKYGRNSAVASGFSTDDIDSERLAEIVAQDLADWGEDETGHVVAYYVDEDGVSRLPWDYPHSSVCDLLFDVVEWTELDDYWDMFRSSKPIEGAKGPRRGVTYFTRTLYEKLKRHGITIPFAHLATVANVALALPIDSQLDEDTARKAVRRYQGKKDIAVVYGPDAF